VVFSEREKGYLRGGRGKQEKEAKWVRTIETFFGWRWGASQLLGMLEDDRGCRAGENRLISGYFNIRVIKGLWGVHRAREEDRGRGFRLDKSGGDYLEARKEKRGVSRTLPV